MSRVDQALRAAARLLRTFRAASLVCALAAFGGAVQGAQPAAASDQGGAAAEASENGNVVTELVRLDILLDDARRARDGAAMVEALAGLAAIEPYVRTPFSRTVALTRKDDFDLAARLVRGDSELVRKLLSIEPARLRHPGGARDAAGGRAVLSPRDSARYLLSFPPNDQATVVARGGRSLSVKLIVRSPDRDEAPGEVLCDAATNRGDPVCTWPTGPETTFEVIIQKLTDDDRDVELIYSN